MFESRQRLDLYEKLIQCAKGLTLTSYDSEGNIYSPSENMPSGISHFISLENTLDYALAFGKEHQHPIVLSNSLNMMWIAAFEKEESYLRYVHAIGPIFVDDVSHRSIHEHLEKMNLSIQLKNEFQKLIQTLPVISITNFLQYGLMLHYCTTREELKLHEFHYQSHESESTSHMQSHEPVDKHGTWATEQTIIKLVQTGNLNYRSIMSDLALDGSVGKLSTDDPMRQMKNTIISSIIIVSRAAINGGLYPDLAYTLSDKYIQNVESCSSISELSIINEIMMDDFIQRVHKLKTQDASSLLIQKCKDYIAVHIKDEISLETLAKEMNYTPYYLSRKFKEETKMELRIYIRQTRMEYSKILLKSTSMSIQEISESLHFCSQSYYAQHFKQLYHVSPSEYRLSDTSE